MDMPTQEHQASFADTDRPLSRIFTRRLLQGLAAAMPGVTSDKPESWGEQWEATRELFNSLNPRDPADAQLAAIAVAAAQSAMDNFARAARPGVTDEAAVRLRGSALAAGRTYATVLRYLRKSQAEAAPARREASPARPRTPAAAPAEPDHDVPRDAPVAVAMQPRAEPLPPAHRQTALAYPRDPLPAIGALPAAAAMRSEREALAVEERQQAASAAAGGGSG